MRNSTAWDRLVLIPNIFDSIKYCTKIGWDLFQDRISNVAYIVLDVGSVKVDLIHPEAFDAYLASPSASL